VEAVSGVLSLALLAFTAVNDWLARLPSWLLPALIVVWIVEKRWNATDRKVTEAMTELRAIRESLDEVKSAVDGIETELGEVKSTVDGMERELGEVKLTVDGIETDLAEVKSTVDDVKNELADQDGF
jgi:septal ring factor EnvC (AmiA/AmiB activator)